MAVRPGVHGMSVNQHLKPYPSPPIRAGCNEKDIPMRDELVFENLLTPAQVASIFSVNPKTVTRWAKAGKLTSIRTLGGHRRYRETEVRALLAGIPVTPAAPRAVPAVVSAPAGVAAECPDCGYTLTSRSHKLECLGVSS